jgi:hypothetical protein
MSEEIKWILNIQVVNGLGILASQARIAEDHNRTNEPV